VTIDILPDVVLLEIFDSHVDKGQAWHTLVHVCRKWRNVVFGSPRRLDLRLQCNARTPVREMLDVWPPLPIVIGHSYEKWGDDNIIAALEHNNRISELALWHISSSQFEKVLAAMQQPFPALTDLLLRLADETAPVVPDLFLGGFAPGLQSLYLDHIPFPGLPKLLLSANHLVQLTLWSIPHSGYFSPEAMVTGLSVLTRLERLAIGFESPRSRPVLENRRPPPPTRILLPVLTQLWFKGSSEYLENLVGQIDAPLLNYSQMTFFHQLMFDTPQLAQFIGRIPKFKANVEACVTFSHSYVLITLPQPLDGTLDLKISCQQADWQLSSLAQVCSSSPLQTLIPTVERLYISSGFPLPHWQDDIEHSQWLELLHPFTAVKDLHISPTFLPRIVPALQELVGERVTEVLPALRTLFLDEPLASRPVQEIIEQFVAARQLASHPIAVSRRESED
jgi:hypothetical protein